MQTQAAKNTFFAIVGLVGVACLAAALFVRYGWPAPAVVAVPRVQPKTEEAVKPPRSTVTMGAISGTVTDARTGQPLAGVPIHVSYFCPHGIDPAHDLNGSGFKCEGVAAADIKTTAAGQYAIASTNFYDDNDGVSYTLTVGYDADASDQVFTKGPNDTGTGLGIGSNGYHASRFKRQFLPPFEKMAEATRYDAALLGAVTKAADCAAYKAPADRDSCLELLANTETEAIWPHGGDAASAETARFFDLYFQDKAAADLSGRCATKSPDDTCLMLKAVSTGDVSLCKGAQTCVERVAVFGNRPDLCEQVLPKLRGQDASNLKPDGLCLARAAIFSRNQDLCEQLGRLHRAEASVISKGDRWDAYYLTPLGYCWTAMAEQKNDPALCDRMPPIEAKTSDCRRGVAAFQKK